MDHNDQAYLPFLEAREIFLALNEPLSASCCLIELGNIHRVQHNYDDAIAALLQAQLECQNLDDVYGNAECLRVLGK
jgi:hypothetical protein